MAPLTIILIFLAAYFSAVVFSRLTKLPLIVWFLIIGASISFFLPSISETRHNLDLLTEIGVAFLLFEVGTHLPLKKLFKTWKEFLISGPAQVICVALVLYLALLGLGLNDNEAIIIAFALALSSTAVVMQIFKEHSEVGCPVAERAVSVLVTQDIIAVLGLSIMSSMGAEHPSHQPSFMQLFSILGTLTLVLGLGSLLVRPFFNLVVYVKAQEIITPAAQLYVLVLAWAAHYLGLSYALGAFLGGVSIASTRYVGLVTSELQPFRSLLLALFFISIGLSIDVKYVFANSLTIAALTIGFMLLKSCANFVALRLTASKEEPSTYLAGVLSQGSEFTFIVGLLALQIGLITFETSQLLQAVVALSLMISPLFAGLGCMLARSCSRPVDVKTLNDDAEIIITEFDEIAQQIANALDKVGIKYRGHDRDLERLTYAASRGYKVFFSDPDRPLTLSRAALGKAKVVVNLVDDESISSNLVESLQKMAPEVPIIAATKSLKLFDKFSSLGLAGNFIKNSSTAKLIFSELTTKLANLDESLRQKLADWSWEELAAT